MPNTNSPTFQVGMSVYFSTAYGRSQGQIVGTAYPDFLGERFVVRDDADGREYGVPCCSMSVSEPRERTNYIDDLTHPPTDEFLEWFAQQCAEYGCD